MDIIIIGTESIIPCMANILNTPLSDRVLRLLPLRVKDICLHKEEEEEGAGASRHGPRVCYGKSMSAMHGLYGGGICGPEHCCSLDIELGRSETKGRGYPP